MLEVEVFGARLLSPPLPLCEVERLCELALASAGVGDGHLAVEFVDAVRIGELNAEHRGKDGPTDVLSFPIDGVEPNPAGNRVPRELGDIVICPEHTVDLREAIVHGALHLVGMDHETDDGQMLAVQAEILRWGPLDA
jgi:probable rRNA maturation factor